MTIASIRQLSDGEELVHVEERAPSDLGWEPPPDLPEGDPRESSLDRRSLAIEGDRRPGASRTGAPAVSIRRSQVAQKKTKKPSRRRRYGNKASEKVEKALHELKRGKLRSGGSGKRVTSRKQAIAIGLSEARRAGGKVPSPPRRPKRKS